MLPGLLGTVIQNSDPGAWGYRDPRLSAGGWHLGHFLPGGLTRRRHRPPLVNARQTHRGLRTLLALGPLLTLPGERRADCRAPGGPVARGTGRGVLRLSATGEETARTGAAVLSGEAGRWANGGGRLCPPLTVPFLPLPPSQGGG